jgi:hypothetical protein
MTIAQQFIAGMPRSIENQSAKRTSEMIDVIQETAFFSRPFHGLHRN